MDKLYLMIIGNVDTTLVACVSDILRKEYDFEIVTAGCHDYPSYAFELSRNQYYSKKILARLAYEVPADCVKLVAITEIDLCTPVLSFVFGEAQLAGRIAVVSLNRLRQEFYHLPSNHELLAKRLIKEVIHELGHSFGLYHCENSECVMNFSDNILGIDNKSMDFCPRCACFFKEKRQRKEYNATL